MQRGQQGLCARTPPLPRPITMLVLKAWYLLYFSAASCLYPFFNLIFRRAGLSEQQVGTVAALRPFVGLPAGAAFAGVADVYRLHRGVLLATFLASSAARLSASAATRFPAILAVMLVADLLVAPVTIMVDAAAMAACAEEGAYARQRLFGAVGWGTFSLIAGSCIQRYGSGAAFWLNGALAAATLVPTALLPWGPLHAKLERQGHRGPEEGECRTGDGYAIDVSLEAAAPPSTAVRMGRSSPGRRSPERSPTRRPPRERAPCLKPGAAPTTPPQPPPPSTASRPPQVRFCRDLGTLLSSPEALVFFAMATVMGSAVGTIECVLFLFLEDLGGSETLMGLTLTFTCIAETAVFYWTGAIVRALGLDRCFHLCFAAFLLRLGCYATLAAWPSPWCVLPVELLHGLTFGLTWSAGTAKCAAIAPPGLEATTQSAFQGLIFGVGASTSGTARRRRLEWLRGLWRWGGRPRRRRRRRFAGGAVAAAGGRTRKWPRWRWLP